MKCTKSEKLYLLELFKDIFNENKIEIVISIANYRENGLNPEYKIYDVMKIDTKEIICHVIWTPAEYRAYLKGRNEYE